MLVKYGEEEEKYKFSDSKEIKFIFKFRVVSPKAIEQTIETEQLRAVNKQMGEHIKSCRDELEHYKQFLEYTNKIVQ